MCSYLKIKAKYLAVHDDIGIGSCITNIKFSYKKNKCELVFMGIKRSRNNSQCPLLLRAFKKWHLS